MKSNDIAEMHPKRTSVIYLSFSILLTVYFTNFFYTPQNTLISFSGVSSTLEETAEFIKGFGRFLNSLKSVIDVISYVIDIKVLLLLIAVSLIGSFLSVLGIPKGKFLFLCSMGIADLFWFIWIRSFNPEYSTINKISLMIKTNVTIMTPFAVIYFFRSPIISGKFIPKIKSFIKSLFKKKKPALSFGKDDITLIMDRLQESCIVFHKSFINDFLKQKDRKDFEFSGDSLKFKKQMEDILKKLKENN